MTSAATQAAEPVMWCAMLNRPIAGPAPCVEANAKAIRAPTPATHMLAASAPAWPRPAVGAAAQPGGQAADRAHGRADRHAEQLQRDVVAAGRYGVQEHDGGGSHGQHRDGEGAQVE